MARLLIDGFEHGMVYGNSLWDQSSYFAVQTGLAALTGTYGINIRGTGIANFALRKTLDSGVTSLYSHFRMNYITGGDDTNTFEINYYDDDENLQGTLVIVFQPYYDKSTFTIKDSAGTEKDSIELALQGEFSLQVKFSNTDIDTKVMTIRLNNEDVMTETWTNPTEDNVATTKFEFKGTGSTNASNLLMLDDVVLDDSDWPGDPKIYGLVPTSNGADSDWTPSAGNNYECVDELPGAEADYVASIVDDDLDIYGFENLAASVINVKSVQVLALAKTPGSPLSEYLQMVVRTGGSDFNSASQKLSTGKYRLAGAIWETNPDTAVAWTPADIDALQAGIQLKSA